MLLLMFLLMSHFLMSRYCVGVAAWTVLCFDIALVLHYLRVTCCCSATLLRLLPAFQCSIDSGVVPIVVIAAESAAAATMFICSVTAAAAAAVFCWYCC